MTLANLRWFSWALLLTTVCNFAFAKVQVEVSQDVTLLSFDGAVLTDIKAGEKKAVDLEQPVWVQSKSGLPMVFFPLKSQEQELKLDIPPIDNFLSRDKQFQIDHHLSSLLADFIRVQSMIRERKLDDAQSKLDAMMTVYADVKFLNFLKASLLVLKGEKTLAIKAVKEGLAAHPDFEEGKSLLKNLTGGSGS